ncbi:hypothetical protein [Curtobacterium sp. MCJR17_043]|uniref:hypothetical protein n=1 Tax=Curtobacterium sp. MCJR17_043 TaxID=2175660 RepID=UPI0024DFEF86|nr:hypothetical protein [Curtobacterium sp. MCJR17_043]WIB36187.1 hypothetical protein DEJ15_02950 [Curtobacterium sp. MCJR17_043]
MQRYLDAASFDVFGQYETALRTPARDDSIITHETNMSQVRGLGHNDPSATIGVGDFR